MTNPTFDFSNRTSSIEESILESASKLASDHTLRCELHPRDSVRFELSAPYFLLTSGFEKAGTPGYVIGGFYPVKVVASKNAEQAEARLFEGERHVATILLPVSKDADNTTVVTDDQAAASTKRQDAQAATLFAVSKVSKPEE